MTRALAALVGLCAAGALGQANAEQAVLHAVPLETELRGPQDWKAVELEVTPRDAKAAPALFLSRRGVRAGVGGAFVLKGLKAPAVKERPQPRHAGPSWVIDFDQAAFKPVFEAAPSLEGKGPAARAEALTAFASAWLTRKSYDRGLDLASQVAKHRAGDCTEHAVFLTALLRKYGVPARAMLGLVVVSTAQEPRAYGHMWVEAFVDGAWRVYDAALLGYPALHLPAGELSDEGPGYALGLISAVNSLGFSSLRLRQAGR